MKVGYIRVFKQGQHEVLQIDALRKAGCEKWFLDKITGTWNPKIYSDPPRATMKVAPTYALPTMLEAVQR